MAVQIPNEMPAVAVHRGEPLSPMRALAPQRAEHSSLARMSGRAWFAVGTIALHVVALIGVMNAQRIERVLAEPEPMVAALVDAPAPAAEQPRDTPPPLQDVRYVLPEPQDVPYEVETIAPPPLVATTAIADPNPAVTSPPVIESVEYVRAPAPLYPSESSRRRERGTVLLRVLVDALGRPAQIELERSSGFSRLDDAARAAVQKALFRPHEVNGIAQPAQVLIPIEFARRVS